MFKFFRDRSISPFILGCVEQRDLVMLDALLKAADQGVPIINNPLPPGIIESDSLRVDSGEALLELFSKISMTVRAISRHNRFVRDRLIILVSDSLRVNGLAGRLHPGENKHVVNVTAGTFLRGFILTLRFVGGRSGLAGRPFRDARSFFFDDVFPIPGNNEDLVYAETCAYYGALTVWFHELGHVVRGHTSYIEKATGTSALAEVGEDDSQEKLLHIRRVLEVDADLFAGELLASTIFSDVVENPSLLSSETFKERLEKVAVGILALYMGFGRGGAVYFSGPCRALFILTALIKRCGASEQYSEWLGAVVDKVQLDMVNVKMIRENDSLLYAKEVEEMAKEVLPKLSASQHLWLNFAPWDGARDTIPRSG